MLDTDLLMVIIGVFFLPIVMIILIVWFKSVERRKRNQLQADLYLKALEMGQPIPTDLFVEPKKKRNPLSTGIICIAAGIGTSLFLWLFFSTVNEADMPQFASLGIIPFLVGVAYVIIHFIEKKNAVDEDAK